MTLLTPLRAETAATEALIPFLLLRGSETCPDMQVISAKLDQLYGGSVSPVVRKKGEVHCLGLLGSFLSDAYTLDGSGILAEAIRFVGELLLRPHTENGAFSGDYTRQEKDGSILVTLTRWHEDDLAGRLLEAAKKDPEADQWEVLLLPAVAEAERHHKDPRQEGDALWTGKYPLEELRKIRATIGIYDWSAMYQQRPQPAGGTIFKREWMNQTYRELPAGATMIQSWDLPFKNSEASAKCAGIVMARKGAQLFFVDVVNDKMGFTTSVTAIKNLTAKHPKARAKVVEDKANGPAIIDYLGKTIPGMIPFNPKGSKEDRALSVAPYFEAGNVLFPEFAPWKADLIDDLLRFPGTTYKDTVDATVQAILYLMSKPTSHIGGDDMSKESYWRR